MRLAALTLLSTVLLLEGSALAAPVWTGDFEANDLKEWSSQLNKEHIAVVGEPTIHGTHAGQITLTNDAVWPNGLKRVELNHSPTAGRTLEGKKVFFAWSFYLPKTLPTDPAAQIGYWESKTSYQQMMSFEVKGEDITFSTRKPTNKVAWNGKGVVTPAAWHRIAIGILWSKDATMGKVDVWFDGKQVVTAAGAQTRNDDNELFTQVGLLRGKVEFTDAPVIVIDDAVEGDSLDDVRPELPAPPTTPPDAGTSSGTDAGSSGPTTPPPSTSTPTNDAGTAPNASASPSSEDDGGCQTSRGGASWLAGLLLLPLLRRRKRS